MSDKTDFILVNCSAQAIADAANVAYWLECHDIEARHHRNKIDTKFLEIADRLGYVVAPKAEIPA